jgi:hypothetical protein
MKVLLLVIVSLVGISGCGSEADRGNANEYKVISFEDASPSPSHPDQPRCTAVVENRTSRLRGEAYGNSCSMLNMVIGERASVRGGNIWVGDEKGGVTFFVTKGESR